MLDVNILMYMVVLKISQCQDSHLMQMSVDTSNHVMLVYMLNELLMMMYVGYYERLEDDISTSV